MSKILALALYCLVISAISCRSHHDRATTIKVTDGSTSIRIKYAGGVKFSSDSNSIASISPEGFIWYEKNGDRLDAETNKEGQMSLSLTASNGKEINPAGAEGKKFMAVAIKEMIKQGVNQSR
jgi:hypothetical protein